jgi:hypothetical protein
VDHLVDDVLEVLIEEALYEVELVFENNNAVVNFFALEAAFS